MKPQALIALLMAAAAGTARADQEIVISAGLVPPHITAAGAGREADILRETLGACGYRAVFAVRPFARHWDAYAQDPRHDAVATAPPERALPGTLAALGYVSYQNGASFLADRAIAARRADELAGLRVVAFAEARSILPSVDAAAAAFAEYREVADQETQSRLLFSGRADVVIGDGMIFAHFNDGLRARAAAGERLGFDPGRPVAFTALFPPTPYGVRFRDPRIAAAFERCFEALAARGRIDAINAEYAARYRATLGTEYLGY